MRRTLSHIPNIFMFQNILFFWCSDDMNWTKGMEIPLKNSLYALFFGVVDISPWSIINLYMPSLLHDRKMQLDFGYYLFFIMSLFFLVPVYWIFGNYIVQSTSFLALKLALTAMSVWTHLSMNIDNELHLSMNIHNEPIYPWTSSWTHQAFEPEQPP